MIVVAPYATATAQVTSPAGVTTAPTPGNVSMVETESAQVLAPQAFSGTSDALADAIAKLNGGELQFIQDAESTKPDPAMLDTELQQTAADAMTVAQNAEDLGFSTISQNVGNATAKQTAQQYTSIALLSYGLVIDAQNTREVLGGHAMSPGDAAGVIAEYGARLWNPSVTEPPSSKPKPTATPAGTQPTTPNNPFIPHLKNSSAVPPTKFLSNNARTQLKNALGSANRLHTWVAATGDSVSKKLTLPVPKKLVANSLDRALLAALKTLGGQKDADAARQVAAAELALLSGAPFPAYQGSAPLQIEFAAKRSISAAKVGQFEDAFVPAMDGGVAALSADTGAADYANYLFNADSNQVTLIGQSPLRQKDADVTMRIQNIQVTTVDRSVGGGHAARVSYSYQVTWLADFGDGFFLRCGGSGYQSQKGPSGVVSFSETVDLDQFPGLVAIHCDAVDELGRDGEEIGRTFTTFLIGSPDEATQVAQATQTAEQENGTGTAEIETGAAIAAQTDEAQTAQAQALQTVEAQGTQQAVQGEVSGTQTVEFLATVTQIARSTQQAATAQETAHAVQTQQAVSGNVFTLVGTFNLSQGDSGCRFSTQPSTVGKLTINVDLNKGTASGTLDGGGGGRRDGLFTSSCGGADIVWSYTLSGNFSGSVDPNSGALSMSGTIADDNPYHYENCKDTNGDSVKCSPGGSPHSNLPITLAGTIDRTNHTGKGTLQVTVSLTTEGDWSAGQ